MSRYNVPQSFHKQEGLEIAVGWDNPLETFFAQVTRPASEDSEDNDEMLLWLGGEIDEHILNVEELTNKLSEYASLPEEIINDLRNDYENRTEPSSLQKAMREMFKSLKDS